MFLVGAVALAGCGGSRTPSVASLGTTTSRRARSGPATSQTGPQQAGLEYARCMRAHGVPGFPDPGAGGGFTFARGSGVDPSSPAFRAAQAACEKLMGGGLAPGTQTHPAAAWLAKMVAAAHCMRRHGVPGFPDPTTAVPSPRVLGGGGVISNIEGAVFVLPAATVDMRSTAFARAARTCGFPLHDH